MQKLRLAHILGSLLALISVFALADYLVYDTVTAPPSVKFNTKQNALWLRYLWYAGKHTAPEFSAMYKELATHQMRYGYFHVLTTKPDGRLKLSNLEGARKLTAECKRQAPNARAIAWVYIGSAEVNLDSAEVRKNLVEQLGWLTNECGFDGVQVDYEFALCGAQGLLRLLEECRRVLPKGALLSVATPMWYPGVLWGWSDEYFTEVAQRSDQLAVMCYDSYLYLPRAYTWLVSQQAIHVTADCAKANPACKVILGLPTYNNQTLAHHPYSESLKNALRGVQYGLADMNAKTEAFEGIALFADYTTDNNEWVQYEEYWLGNMQGKDGSRID